MRDLSDRLASQERGRWKAYSMLWQLAINGIAAGAIYSLVAISFALIYNVTKFFHFTHGIFYTIGAYATFFFYQIFEIPLPVCIVLAVCVAAFLGYSLYLIIYRPLRKIGASDLILLLVSLGIYIVIQNVISLSFGDEIKSLNLGGIQRTIDLAGAVINFVQLITCMTSALVVVIAVAVVRVTKAGKAFRAVSSDEQLASLCGIDVERIILGTFAVGSALACLAGILNGLDVDLTPTMGLAPLMMSIVAVIVGGKSSIIGIMFGALFVGISQHIGVWKIGSQWQEAIAFVIFVVFLLFRPDGFAGNKSSKTNV